MFKGLVCHESKSISYQTLAFLWASGQEIIDPQVQALAEAVGVANQSDACMLTSVWLGPQ